MDDLRTDLKLILTEHNCWSPPTFFKMGGSSTAVLKGKVAQWQEIARFVRLHATYFYLDPLVL